MMDKGLVIIGASGHGRVIADIAQKNGYKKIVFLDDNPSIKQCGNYFVAGTCNDVDKFSKYDFVVGIGDGRIRERIHGILKEKQYRIISLVHPAATVAGDVQIKFGTVIMAGSVVNSGAVIGEGCIINTCSSVDHDCVISDFVHVAVGVHLAGTVTIGRCTWIGAGATVSNNVNICSDSVIGAGAVVIENIDKTGIYIGVPAKEKNMIKNPWGGKPLPEQLREYSLLAA